MPEDHIVRHEDIVASGGKVPSAVVSAASELDEPLKSRNLNELYGRDAMMLLGERLIESDGAYWHFYTRESVEDLLQKISGDQMLSG